MNIRFALLISLIITILGCKKEERDFRESNFFVYYSRQCNYAWAFNARGETITIGNQSANKYTSLKENSSVKISEYILGFTTCNISLSDISQSLSPDYMNNYLSEEIDPITYSPYMVLARSSRPMTDQADPIIENRLRTYLENYNTQNMSRADFAVNIDYIDYRITPLKYIKITCSTEIAGIKPGNPLNDLFLVKGYPINHYFIITSNKNIITDPSKISNISINQYLSYTPMAPAELRLQMKKNVSIAKPIIAQFTIELQTEDRTTIKTETKPIQFIP